jgi:hypothetical protein
MIPRAVCALIALALTATGIQSQEAGFPHALHRGLFPVCTGCHVPDSPDRARIFPDPASCNGCHDGTEQPRVNWAAPAPASAGILRFDHAEHASEAASDAIACEGCHVEAGGDRMSVERAVVADCLSCHAHQATDHLATAECSTCHRPLAQSGLGADRIATLPLPPGHARAGFEGDHSGGADCQVCHTRERCTTCHVNGAAVREIQAVPAAVPGMDLPVFAARYPTPTDHLGDGWLSTHGAGADATSCTTCHTRDDCTACHVEAPPSPVPSFPVRGEVHAPGVGLQRARPVSHERIERFDVAHGADAAVSMSNCAACHGRTECAACHDAPAQPSFHPANFVDGHSNAAWTRRLECSNCHDVGAFCTECHQQAGIAARGSIGSVYHDAEGAWLLRHGQAARQGLETCVSCHTQTTCLRCHSGLGSFRVSPHGPDFDPGRARARNAVVCRTCHLSDPGRGGTT